MEPFAETYACLAVVKHYSGGETFTGGLLEFAETPEIARGDGSRRLSEGRIRGDGDPHKGIRPAALEPAAAFSARVVGLQAQDVFARRAERGGRCGFAVRLVGLRYGICERDAAGSTKLGPRQA